MSVSKLLSLGCLWTAAAVSLGACGPADPGTGGQDPARAELDGRLTGNVLYRERIALPADAVVNVQLQDVSRADAAADVLAQQTIATAGKQVPIPFELRYSAARVDPMHRYAVRAEIRDAASTLLFTTATQHSVTLERGASPPPVDVLVQRAGREPAGDAGPAAGPDPAAAAAELAGAWRLVAFRDDGGAAAAPAADQIYTLDFLEGPDGRIAGQAHCNRFHGTYRTGTGAALAVMPLGATLAACTPPTLGSDYLRALAAVTRYDLDGGRLRLAFGASGELAFERALPAAAAAAPAPGRTFVFDCYGDVSFTVRTGPGEMALWLPPALGDRYLVLSATPAASGARYQEGDTVFWSRGELATLEAQGQRFVDCKSSPAKAPWADAKRRGVTLRALGNEPAWTFEVQGRDRLIVTTDVGATRTELPWSVPTVAGARTTYDAATGEHSLTAVVERTACVDTMSGEAFEAAVSLTLDGKTLRGCGRFL